MSSLPLCHCLLSIVSYAHSYFTATLELFRFYFLHISTFTRLFGDLNFPKFLQDKQKKRAKTMRLSVAKKLIRDYNVALSELKEKLNLTCPNGNEIEFQTRMWLIFAVRLCTILAAYSKANLAVILLVNSLQFLVAPLSFFVSTVYFFCYLCPMVIPHYVVQLLLQFVCPSFINSLSIPVNSTFIVAFLLSDQLICLVMSWVGAPKFKCQKFRFREFLTHMLFGNVNCKSYFLVLLVVLKNSNCYINLVTLTIDWYFGLTDKLSNEIAKKTRFESSCLFYHMHRIGHLPTVYQHAHKLHHYLQGSNAFDAHHLYGSGLPEEWVELSVEMLLSINLGLNPLIFNPTILRGSWDNKIDHMKKLDGGNNHHAYHHILHSKNFSNFGGLLDLVFDTHSKDDEIDLDGYLMERSETDETVEISFTLVDS